MEAGFLNRKNIVARQVSSYSEVDEAMEGKAQFRAQWAKQIVATAKRHPEPLRTQVLGAIGDHARAKIREAGLLDYVDGAVFVSMLGGIHRTLGQQEHNEYYAKALALALDTPLLKPLYKGGSGMFGRGPSGILRMTPFVWKLLTRGCGSVTATKKDSGALQLVFAVGSPYFEDAAFVAGMAGYMHGALAWTQTEGEVEWTINPQAMAIQYDVTWS